MIVAAFAELAPRLRGVVFVSEAAFRLRFDIQRVGLCMEGGGDNGVMRLFALASRAASLAAV